MTNSAPLLLGHRGARRSAPENTLTAFDLALAHGCDGFEFDVRSTADQRAIVCHDSSVGGLVVAQSEYSRIVQNHRSLGPANSSQACDPLPCLEDVILRYAGRAYLDIELKATGLENKLVALVSSLAAETYVASSFLPEVLQSIHSLQRAIPLGLICDREQTLARWRDVPCNVVIPERKLVTQKLIDEVHGEGKKIFVWTVNEKEEMLLLSRAGVDAIISDDTELLGRVLSHRRRSRSG